MSANNDLREGICEILQEGPVEFGELARLANAGSIELNEVMAQLQSVGLIYRNNGSYHAAPKLVLLSEYTGANILKYPCQSNFTKVPQSTPVSNRCHCVFHSDEFGTCDFEVFSRFFSRNRIPQSCPRGIIRSKYHGKVEKKGLRFFELAILGELKHAGGRLTLANIVSLFPFLGEKVVIRILYRLKHRGKIAKLLKGGRSKNYNKVVWKLGNPLFHVSKRWRG